MRYRRRPNSFRHNNPELEDIGAKLPNKRKRKLQHKKPSKKPSKKSVPLKFMDYKRYIRSSAWKATRKRAIEHYGEKCGECGRTEHIEVHHKNYDRLGCEQINDLEILCSDCHSVRHEDRFRRSDAITREFLQIFR